MNEPVLDYDSPKKLTAGTFIRACVPVLIVALIGCVILYAMLRSSVNARNTSGPSPEHIIKYIRDEIDCYRIDHGKPPSEGVLFAQLLHATNKAGVATSGPPTPAFPYGPYCRQYVNAGWLMDSRGHFPINQWTTGSAAVSNAASPKVGWVYIVSGYDYTFKMVNAKGDGTDDDW